MDTNEYKNLLSEKNNDFINMRKKLLIILFFLVTGMLKVETKEMILMDRENPELSLDSTLFRVVYKVEQQVLKDGNPFMITDTMALNVGQRWSVYYDLHKSYKDSIAKADFKMNPPKSFSLSYDENALQERLEARIPIVGTLDASMVETMEIFKDRYNGELSIFDKGPLEGFDTFTYFKLIEKVPPQDWVISEDTFTVLGYLCQKATTHFRGRGYTAWFTLDIPISDGPWKLYGLPGMILKIIETNGIFNFQAIGLQEISNTTINFPSNKKIVPCESWQKMKVFRETRFNPHCSYVELII